jgi:hypothetical protein
VGQEYNETVLSSHTYIVFCPHAYHPSGMVCGWVLVHFGPTKWIKSSGVCFPHLLVFIRVVNSIDMFGFLKGFIMIRSISILKMESNVVSPNLKIEMLLITILLPK